MTSTTGPQPEVLDEIEALFSWNPPRLIPAPLPSSKKLSTDTRLPAFYDKHFSSNLALKRIERLPSLVQDLASNVDAALQAALKTLPALDGFITARQRKFDIQNLDEVVTDGQGVADFYHVTTARFCSPLASTLALHPTASFSRWRSLLLWTQSSPPSSYPIMDGLLRFIGEGVDKIKALRAAIVKSMGDENRRIFEKMRESMSPLATWEMRSICAGSREVMTAVPTLGKFPWTTCNAPDFFSNPKHQKEQEKVGRVVAGPDVQAPPWSFPACPLSPNGENGAYHTIG